MDDSASTDIINVDKLVAYDFIKSIENDLYHGHQQKLIRSNSSKNGAKSDENRSDRVRGGSEVIFLDIDSSFTPLVVHDLSPETTPKQVILDDYGIDAEGIRQSLP